MTRRIRFRTPPSLLMGQARGHAQEMVTPTKDCPGLLSKMEGGENLPRLGAVDAAECRWRAGRRDSLVGQLGKLRAAQRAPRLPAQVAGLQTAARAARGSF